MKTNNIYISNKANMLVLFAALFSVCALIIARTINHTFAAAKVASRYVKVARLWLVTPKTYFAGDGEGVTVTGYQFLGINILALFICLICSVKF